MGPWLSSATSRLAGIACFYSRLPPAVSPALRRAGLLGRLQRYSLPGGATCIVSRFIRLSALGLVLQVGGCAAPVSGLWPPPPDRPVQEIVVSLDTWHAMIALPLDDGPEGQALRADKQSVRLPDSTPMTQAFEEWGYAERAWYVEGRQGPTGAIRALLWPTAGTVEVGQHDRLWAERTPQPPADLFILPVTAEGAAGLRQHLRATIADDLPIAHADGSQFYPARHTYHLFHTCHQYAAAALRAAGLPLRPALAFTRSSLALQLQRAMTMTSAARHERLNPTPATSTR